ncbi:MAG: hypothetical protein ACE5KM_02095 [Planctomycetaceae bacterium]
MGSSRHNLAIRGSAAIAAIALGIVCSCAGCSLLRTGWSDVDDRRGDTDKGSSHLPAIRRPGRSVGLEIVFVERPANDPLMSDRNLWEGVDTVGELAPEVRMRLRGSGFRVGHSSATPNEAIETMLGLTSADTGTRAPVGREQLSGRRIYRPAGGETEVQTSRVYPEFVIPASDSRSPRLEFRNARCLFRVKVRQVANGWTELEFTPEIHHGRNGWRPIATGMGWQGTTSQKVHRLYDRRFRLTLNLGEMAILSAGPKQPDSTGSRFFLDGKGPGGKQRVLIVRVADIAGNR